MATMSYKTIKLKIHNPTQKKRQIIDKAMINYSKALQFLVDKFYNLIIKQDKLLKKDILKLIDDNISLELNSFEIEPFKDSLIQEFCSIMQLQISQKGSDKAKKPLIYVDDENYEKIVDDLLNRFDNEEISKNITKNELSRIVSKNNNYHSLYFGRYDTKRNYCLLYDEQEDRFFAKIFIVNANNKIPSSQIVNHRKLLYVYEEKPIYKEKLIPVSYMILPLSFGKYQYDILKEALDNPSILRTAKLTKVKNDYYLAIAIECEKETKIICENYLGIARGEKGVHYTLCDSKLNVVEYGIMSYKNDCNQIANKIVKFAKIKKAIVSVEKNGGLNDGFLSRKKKVINCNEYKSIVKLLRYKLPDSGMPKLIEYTPNNLYMECPKCHSKREKNIINNELFICINCGYASEISKIGSYVLATRPNEYENSKIPIYVKRINSEMISCFNTTLEFSVNFNKKQLTKQDLNSIVLLLKNILLTNGFEQNKKKYALICKLRSVDNIKKAIRFSGEESLFDFGDLVVTH